MRISGVLVGLLSVPVLAGSLSQGERDYALSQLHATRKMFVDAVTGLSAAQWKFKPADNRWSIAEIGRHLVLSEDFMMAELKKRLASPPVEQRLARGQDAKFYASIVDRSQKHEAPDALKPAGKIGTPAQVAQDFEARRDATLEYVRTTQQDLRAHVQGAGENATDAYQWLLAIAAHTERHMGQIKEVMASPGFPKK